MQPEDSAAYRLFQDLNDAKVSRNISQKAFESAKAALAAYDTPDNHARIDALEADVNVLDSARKELISKAIPLVTELAKLETEFAKTALASGNGRLSLGLSPLFMAEIQLHTCAATAQALEGIQPSGFGGTLWVPATPQQLRNLAFSAFGEVETIDITECMPDTNEVVQLALSGQNPAEIGRQRRAAQVAKERPYFQKRADAVTKLGQKYAADRQAKAQKDRENAERRFAEERATAAWRRAPSPIEELAMLDDADPLRFKYRPEDGWRTGSSL